MVVLLIDSAEGSNEILLGCIQMLQTCLLACEGVGFDERLRVLVVCDM
jgi:hypothetical protein